MLLDNKNIVKSVTQFSTGIRYTEGDIFVADGKIYRVNKLDPTRQSGVYNYGGNVYTNVDPALDTNTEYPLYTLYAEPSTETIAGIPYFTEAKEFNNAMEFMQLIGSNDCSLVTVSGQFANYLCSDSSHHVFDDIQDSKYIIMARKHGLQAFAISTKGNHALISRHTYNYELNEGNFINLADFSNDPYVLSNHGVIDNTTFRGLVSCSFNHVDSSHSISDSDFECTIESDDDPSGIEVLKVVVQYTFNGGVPQYQEIVPIFIRYQTGIIDSAGLYCRLRYETKPTSGFKITAAKVVITDDDHVPQLRAINILAVYGLAII